MAMAFSGLAVPPEIAANCGHEHTGPELEACVMRKAWQTLARSRHFYKPVTVARIMGYEEYENYLDSLDHRFFVRGSVVHANFSKPFVVDLDRCSSVSLLNAQARELVIRLLDEKGVDTHYLVQRLARLAKLHHKLEIDPVLVADSMGIVRIDDAVYRKSEQKAPNSVALRFENGLGQYAGHHFTEFMRHDSMTLQVTRNMIGYSGNTQCTRVSSLDVVETDFHLAFFLPEGTNWKFEYATSSKSYWLYANCLVIQHSFGRDMLSQIETDLRAITNGLLFTYTKRVA